MRITRRRVLAGMAIMPGLGLLGGRAARGSRRGLEFGPARPFDFEKLCVEAEALARKPFRPAEVRGRKLLERIDFDAHQRIRFRDERSLWAEGPGAWPVQFFHPGRYFKEPVAIHVLKDGSARELLYSPDFFDIPEDNPARTLPADIGFAGFRIMEPGMETDWVAFLGASYFRSAGALDQYGLSARGIAIDTATPRPEEFPRFTKFWLEPGADGVQTVYALLDGPSITGAYRMILHKGEAVVMDITKMLFAREEIGRLGVAPLTSMFWYSETSRPQNVDWRPEIHDSDGLAIWTGEGERIWRPLNNPREVQTSSFMDTNPRGFGLLQRDRDFENYQDDGVFYERRPSVWVEPQGDWGAGAVQLVEIPTEDEIHDNIAAYWVPEGAVRAGRRLTYSYRLHWVAEEPYPAAGRVVATRLGEGGRPGQPRPPHSYKFVIDFAGGRLAELDREQKVEPVVETSRGEIIRPYALPPVGTDRWRAFFDIHVKGPEAVELRCYLRLGDEALTETWLYRFFPA